jgi:signal transduction histidine kinase
VIQEALTNTTRHAGIGARAHVLLSWAPDQLTIVVEDQRGATPRDEVSTLSTGHGLLGLRERVELVGGTLTVSRTTAGFRLQAELPAAAPAPEPEADPEPEPAASPESRPVTFDLTTGLLGGAT